MAIVKMIAGRIMKIENSFVGGCLYAVMCCVLALFPLLLEKFIRWLAMFIAVGLNGGTGFDYFDFQWFILKVVAINLGMFYMAVLVCRR